jgi:hypothetical protein
MRTVTAAWGHYGGVSRRAWIGAVGSPCFFWLGAAGIADQEFETGGSYMDGRVHGTLSIAVSWDWLDGSCSQGMRCRTSHGSYSPERLCLGMA